MRKIALAMLTTAMIATPALAASNNNQQQPQGAQMQQPQKNNNDQAQQDQNYNQPSQNTQNMQQQQNAQSQPNQQNAENNQPIPPNSLSRSEIKQVQQALDKDGFKAGSADGRWGPKTKDAVKQFQQSKQIQANGQLDQQTVADLGLDTSQFSQSQQK